mmetsp:Transcript_12732/g.16731  ORF Transcript_12732/g.16731 Transcript_12732/m.16731 type:complete len:353 (+) Transcript_12732:156-1214(+)|eukprot:CAMPEP_0117786216 /NCGR_PEP_ID=MMETSP0948-20121206/5713_1 /TAXON_ID=44440 /ORGANISM="Chattonella subsalsa, Strain CCMP2191" /LENGTH=352 /DNA_ID=CAMNT_0005615203 /DNA_START=128 /DNA_END=1186 /DNA_ORIENTATION=+
MEETANHEGLEAVALIEVDKSHNFMWAWSYPSVNEQLENITIAQQNASNPEESDFVVSKFQNTWIYTMHTHLEGKSVLEELLSFDLIVYSSLFNPEKMKSMLQLFSRLYCQFGTPLKILEAFISIFATGSYKDTNSGAPWSASAFSEEAALLGPSGGLREEILLRFGMESVLLWHAMVLKKRVLVLGSRTEEVLALVRLLPLFVMSQKNWDILRPLVTLQEAAEEEDLKCAGVYCAGAVDPTIKGRKDLYDLLVDLRTSEIEVADHAAADFKMGAFHKEVAKQLVDLGANESLSNQDIVATISARTNQLFNEIRSVAPAGQRLTVEILQAKKAPVHMLRFLHNLALAEGLLT